MNMNLKAGIAASALALLALPASAEEMIKIHLIDGYPARAMWVQELSNFFIPEVDKRLAEAGSYKIDWQESYGGSVVKVKGVLDGIKLGLGDVGVVTTIFHTSKLPSQSLAAVTPFIAPDARAVAKAIDEIALEYPAMQKEFEAQDQIYLATGVVLDSYQVFSTVPISSMDDLKGSKVAGGGTNLRYIEGIEGAAGVRGSLNQFYNMLQTGMVEQALLWPEAAATFNMAEVAPYMMQVDMGAINSKTITVNKDFWDDLPVDVQGVLREVAVLYRDHVAGIAMDRAAESRQKYVEAGGSIVELSEEERVIWANSMPNVAQEWVATLDSKGEPGQEILEAYLSKLSDAGYTGLRDWTAE